MKMPGEGTRIERLQKGQMNNQSKTMREVVAEVREHSVGALLELVELDVAVGEVVLNAQLLSAAMREFSAEIEQLGREEMPAARLQALANYARSATQTAEGQVNALKQVKSGLDAWGIMP